jgi:hypothetical protein
MKLPCWFAGDDWIIPQSPKMFRPIVCDRCGRPLMRGDDVGYGGWIRPRRTTKHL